jgi:hypothetical protein
MLNRWMLFCAAFLGVLCLVLGNVGVSLAQDETPTPQAEVEAVDTDAEESAPEEDRFLRLREAEDGTVLAMETSIVRYVPVEGSDWDPETTVDLISAIHIGEPTYYAQLNRIFRGYDSLLFELVTDSPEAAAAPSSGGGQHPVALMQMMMTNVLKLQYQLSGIDYGAENFVHADMTAEQFAQSMSDRNESFLKMFFQMMAQSMARQSADEGPSDIEFLLALMKQDGSLSLKRLLASEMRQAEEQLAFLQGPDGSTLLTERNKVALSVLRERLDEGETKLAIFYGAAHMADFEKRMADEFGLKPDKSVWLTAWDMSGNQVATPEDEQ